MAKMNYSLALREVLGNIKPTMSEIIQLYNDRYYIEVKSKDGKWKRLTIKLIDKLIDERIKDAV
jgi:hypothetical protein